MNFEETKLVKDVLFIIRDKYIKNKNIPISKQVNIYKTELVKAQSLLEGIDINSPEVEKLIYTDDFLYADNEKVIVFEKDHTPWLNVARNNGEITSRFYDRYERYLKEKDWSRRAINTINTTTDIVLDHMKNPKSNNYFCSKGMVIGDIQSGKTANYTALINKSFDAGYKMVIVLAGMTNDLRRQTQLRLDSEVLGYETREDGTKGQPKGVGKIAGSSSLNIDSHTYNDNKGDFKYNNETISFTMNATPKLIVAKKNVSVLKSLLKYLSSSQQNCYTNDKLDIPVLIVDDEVDQASVNTKDTENVDEASTINKLIRKIIDKLNRVSYVGYTATPYANVFINPYQKEEDLFPRDYIINLPKPKGYCGVKEFFSLSQEEDGSDVTYDLCEFMDDYDDFYSPDTTTITAQTEAKNIPASLEKAIINFIIAASVKKQRGITTPNTMLINIVSVKRPATTLVELIKPLIEDMLYEYKYDSKVKEKYKKFWEENIKPVSVNRLGENFHDEWSEIEKYIQGTLQNINNGCVRLLNGDSKDVIDYELNKTGDYIAVGGNKLSRGLTLEGLIVSYFYRSSKQEDTMLQMARWFGYRNGWLDLCRVYTTEDIVKSFIEIEMSNMEFKKDIEEMNNEEKDPLKYGLKVRSCPKLIPTSRTKMRSATKEKISYSGTQSQILTFDSRYTENNLKLVNDFSILHKGTRLNNNKVVFENVSSKDILDLFNNYKEADSTYGVPKVDTWSRYIKKANENGDLVNWRVVISSNKKGDKDSSSTINIGNFEIIKSLRRERDTLYNETNQITPSILRVKVNTAPKDFSDAFYDVPALRDIDTYSSDNQTIDRYFKKDTGVLSIQISDICYKKLDGFREGKQFYKLGDIIPGGENTVGFTVWFPKTDIETSQVEYYVNKVWLEEEQ